MLRLSRNNLSIYLRPTRVTISESKVEGRQAVVGSIDLPVSLQEVTSWSGALNVLDQWFRDNKRTGFNVSVHVADTYARYALIPWPVGIVREAELALYSSAYFEELFGTSFENWNIKVDWREFGKAGIGCSLEAAFLDQVKQISVRNKLRIASINTHFVDVYNNSRDTVKQSEFFLVVVDAGQCVIATFKNKTWHSVRGVKVAEKKEDETLSLLIEREILLQSLPNDVVIYIHGEFVVAKQMLSLGRKVVHMNAKDASQIPSFSTEQPQSIKA